MHALKRQHAEALVRLARPVITPTFTPTQRRETEPVSVLAHARVHRILSKVMPVPWKEYTPNTLANQYPKRLKAVLYGQLADPGVYSRAADNAERWGPE
jgi:hypothetical protein